MRANDFFLPVHIGFVGGPMRGEANLENANKFRRRTSGQEGVMPEGMRDGTVLPVSQGQRTQWLRQTLRVQCTRTACGLLVTVLSTAFPDAANCASQ